MKIKHAIIACGLAFSLGPAAPAPAAEQAATPAPAVTCHNGTFTGVKLDNGVYAYLGIPFAKPPVGPLRWKAPVDAEDRQGNFKAEKYGCQPLQTLLDSEECPNTTPMGEDCLYGDDREDETYLWMNEYDADKRLLRMRLSFFVREGDGRYRKFEETHVQRAHSMDELRSWLAETGFTDVRVYGSDTGESPGPGGKRAYFTCRRPTES